MRYRRGEPRLSLRPPLLLLFLAFGAWAIASLGWTERPDLTLKELRNELLYPLIAFWACYVATQGRRAIAVVLVVLGVGAAVMSVSAAYWAWAMPEGLHFRAAWRRRSSFQCAGHIDALRVDDRLARMARRVAAKRALCSARDRRAARGSGLQHAESHSVARLRGSAGHYRDGAGMAGAPHAKDRGSPSAARSSRRCRNRGWWRNDGGAYSAGEVRIASEPDGGKVVLQADPRLRIWPQVIRKIEERPWLGIGYGRGMGAEVVQQAVR